MSDSAPTSRFAARAAAAIAGQTAIEALGRPIERPTTPSFDGPPPPDLGLFAYFLRATTDDYATFLGRARRKEFWGFALFYLVFWLLGISFGGWVGYLIAGFIGACIIIFIGRAVSK